MATNHIKSSSKNHAHRKAQPLPTESFNLYLSKNKTTSNDNTDKVVLTNTNLAQKSGKITKERLVKYARNLALCPETGICNAPIQARVLVAGLQYNERPNGRDGVPTYNYDEFAALASKFGNAFARPSDILDDEPGAAVPVKAWAFNESENWNNNRLLVLQHSEDPDDLEQSLSEYFSELFLLMGGSKTEVSQDKFVDFMWRKQ